MRARATRRSVVSFLCVLVVGTAILSGCDSALDTAGPGSLAQGVSFSGEKYRVGGKEFTEQLVLCQITAAALESVGASVDDDGCGVVSSEANREALVDNRIDMYWEYTGTAWINYLHRENPSRNADELYGAVQSLDAQNRVVWLGRTPMNDSYAFAVNAETARRLNVQTLTDMARLVGAHSPDDGTVCLEPEFQRRADGWSSVQASYGMSADPGLVSVLGVDPIYVSTGQGNPCVFGEVYGTDPRVRQLGLTVLADDRSALPKYNAALTVRQDAFDRNPDIAKVFLPIANALTDQVMTDLNAQVAINKKAPRTVARDWLRSKGFIT